jgi:hypothetical protein
MKPKRSSNTIILLTLRQILLVASVFLFLLVAGCTTSYNSSKNWHRTPASTGKNRCGCLLNPKEHHAIKLYYQPAYALQA